MKRVQRETYGITRWIPPQPGGALTQCLFCTWGRFVEDRKRKRSAVSRAAAKLRAHVKSEHPDKFPHFATAQEIFTDGAK